MSLTAYQAAKIVNAALRDAGLGKSIPPQMMYNYTTARVRKGERPLIPTVTVDGKVQIQSEGFVKWLDGYIKRQVALAGLPTPVVMER